MHSKGRQEFSGANRFAGRLSGWVNRLTVTGSWMAVTGRKQRGGSSTEGGSDPETVSKCSFSGPFRKNKSAESLTQVHLNLLLSYRSWCRRITQQGILLKTASDCFWFILVSNFSLLLQHVSLCASLFLQCWCRPVISNVAFLGLFSTVSTT